jgi:hypothetical protein
VQSDLELQRQKFAVSFTLPAAAGKPSRLRLCSLFLGLFPRDKFLSIPVGSPPNPFTLKALSTVVWTILAGGALAIFLARWERPMERLPWVGGFFLWASPLRRAALALAKTFERVDGVTGQWPVAGICLLALAAVFGLVLRVG